MTSVRLPTRDPTAGFPQRFGNYVLLARLATGGMGEVFLARHRSTSQGFEKFVVLKRLLPHLMDEPKFVAMFKDEARIAARISHSNVCQTYELGEAEGMYYIAMEYLEGVSLGRVVRDSKRDRRLADLRLLGRLLMQVCEGLHSAHELCDERGDLVNVVHRDVCHANIFVTSTGVAKVLDFGVAKARGALDKTRTGAVKGTYAYSSPEQLRGEQVDRRSDIFSLGVVAWEALTARRLFKRETDYLCFKAITEESVPSPLDFRPDIPPQVAMAVEKALSRDPAARQVTARELGAAIGEGLRGLGPPMSSVAVAALMEDAFAAELRWQRRLCGQGDDDESTGDSTLSQRTLVREQPRLRMPLPPMDTQDIPPVDLSRRPGGAANDDEDEPAFTFTPVNTELPYSSEVPLFEGPPDVETAPTNEIPMGKVDAMARRAAPQDDGPTEEMSPDEIAEFIRTAEAEPLPYKPGESAARHERNSLAVALFVGGLLTIGVLGVIFFVGDGRRDRDGGRKAVGERAAAPVEQPVETAPAPVAKIDPLPAEAEPEPVAAVPDAGAEPAVEPAPEAEPAVEPTPEAEPPEAKPAVERTPKPRRRPKVRRQRDPGFVTIAAHPYATVYIDGKKQGVTPLVRVPLSPGKHSVRAVSSDDGSVKRFKLNVKSGETTRKKITW